jgi:hypothetical protein
MYRKVSAFLAMMFAAVLSFATPSYAQTGQAAPAGLSFPLNATGTAGMFDGTLRITSFAVQNNALVASGIVTGTMVNGSGVRTSVARTVTIPVVTSTAGATKAATAAAATSCGILHLELGPLDLDLLGLVVHLDKVVLDLSAAPGAGNLLGNLLCSVANLLNVSGSLTQIANLLNQILALLG